MTRIYTHQTFLRLRLTTGVNIAGAEETKIYYKTPKGEIKSIDATVEDANNGVIYYDLKPIDDENLLSEAGMWRFWAYIKFGDGRIARGDTVTHVIHDYQDRP